MKTVLKRILSSAVFITSFAFALRMLIVYLGWRYGQTPAKDNVPYGYETGMVARSIAAGHGFSSPLRFVTTGPTAWFCPIYPYLVALVFKIWGIFSDLSHIIIETVNCAFAALTIIPIYSAARRTLGEGVAVGASWVWVFLPTGIFFPIAWVWDTALTALLLALIFWATLAMRERTDVLSWAGYGALWALGVSTNPSVLSLFPFFLAWLVWPLRKEVARWLKPAAAALFLFALGLTPWTIRNYRVFHQLIVLRSNFGLELWLGNNASVPTDWAPWMHPNDNVEEANKYKSMGEPAYMAEKEREAFAFMRTHPVDTVQSIFHRFIENWLAISDSPADDWSHDPLYVKGFMVLNALLSLGCLWGALLLYRARSPVAFPYGIVLLVFPLVFYVTHASLRYRFPMDPVMVILASYACSRLPSLARSRHRHAIPQPTEARSFPSH